MAIIKTNRLLEDYLKLNECTLEAQNKAIIQPIANYFHDPDLLSIQMLLLNHGLFLPMQTKAEQIEALIKTEVWQQINHCFNQLKKEWQGPELAVFIFPADLNNPKLTGEFNGVSGLSFSDKIFLFIDHRATEQMTAALLAHEYSHAVRLNKVHHSKEILPLRDTIILEGIAEVITMEKFGITLLPSFNQQDHEINKLWHQWINPNLSLLSNHPLHHHIMYGDEQIPSLTGYQMGIYMVKQWQDKYQANLANLLQTPTENFFHELKF
ncbi:DUF2268 domain-containing protein [Amphibacillus sp. Q70]|uniref:DUF2268 domain-containing protein n=1 Tax=Amphibacillus sp. Q70 TaxID=3453416 RepID=UPI003F86073A